MTHFQTLGKLWGIGVGPGDRDWLTRQGQQILQTVPIVAFPQNRDGQPGMAYQIIREFLQPEQHLLPLHLPFVTDRATLTTAWNQAINQLLPYLENGQNIAFLAEGDISFYSTFTYIAETLHQRRSEITIDAIPGICSPLAAAAALGMPLAIWDEKIAILPTCHQLDELDRALDWAEVVVLMKMGSVFAKVRDRLRTRGLETQAGLVEWVGSDRQRVYADISQLPTTYRPPYFSLLIVRQNTCTYRSYLP